MRESVEARKLENRNVSLGNMSVPMDLSKDKNTQAANDAMTFRVLVRKGNKPQVYPSPSLAPSQTSYMPISVGTEPGYSLGLYAGC